MKLISTILLATFLFFSLSSNSFAQIRNRGGIHVLDPLEVEDAIKLLKVDEGIEKSYITIPLPLSDLSRKIDWDFFMKKAKENKVVPIVRLVTEFDGKNWKIPTKKNIIDQINFLSSLEWPTDEKHIIVFNEPNHKTEFEGKIDPAQYTRILKFTADWAHTENINYKVLPAGLDMAAPNGRTTMEAFTFLNSMLKEDKSIFDKIDFWNSHSYPNPGFIAPPYNSGKNSVSGFKNELSFLKRETGRDFKVFITETGWLNNPLTSHWLEYYYLYTAQYIWSDDRIVAITPFILKGDPGPFSGFAFLNRDGIPTKQYHAYQEILKK